MQLLRDSELVHDWSVNRRSDFWPSTNAKLAVPVRSSARHGWSGVFTGQLLPLLPFPWSFYLMLPDDGKTRGGQIRGNEPLSIPRTYVRPRATSR